jgi:hypothetical protein
MGNKGLEAQMLSVMKSPINRTRKALRERDRIEDI